jgi:hypothetical protein
MFPAPAEAPRPPAVIGEHPAVLEVAHRTSSDGLIGMQRFLRQADEVRYLLSLLLHGGANWPRLEAEHLWVLSLEEAALETDADGRLVSIELLNVSRGVNLQDLPETEVVTRALDLLAVGRPAA